MDLPTIAPLPPVNPKNVDKLIDLAAELYTTASRIRVLIPHTDGDVVSAAKRLLLEAGLSPDVADRVNQDFFCLKAPHVCTGDDIREIARRERRFKQETFMARGY